MDEKNDPGQAMLDDERHPGRTRTINSRSGPAKVSSIIINSNRR